MAACSGCDSAACAAWTGGCCLNGACSQLPLDSCAELAGTCFGDNEPCNEIDCPGTYLGDLNGDNEVGADDILLMISVYGPCG